MSVVTVADVIKHAERFEEMLEDFYRNVAARSAREGVRMLADYMGRHRRRLKEAIAELDRDEYERICAIPIPYEPEAADCRCFEKVELAPDASAADLLDVAVRFDECLMSFYRQVLRQENDHALSDLFEGLIHSEQQDAVELKKIKAMDYF